MKIETAFTPQPTSSAPSSFTSKIISNLISLFLIILKKPSELHLIIVHVAILVFIGMTVVSPLVTTLFPSIPEFIRNLEISGDFVLNNEIVASLIAPITIAYTLISSVIEKVFKIKIMVSTRLFLAVSLSLHFIAVVCALFYGGFALAWIFIPLTVASVALFGVWTLINILQKNFDVTTQKHL